MSFDQLESRVKEVQSFGFPEKNAFVSSTADIQELAIYPKRALGEHLPVCVRCEELIAMRLSRKVWNTLLKVKTHNFL